MRAGVEVRPARLSEVLPIESWSREEKALEIGRIQRAKAMLAAYEAAVVVSFAADGPGSGDRQQDEPGAASPDWSGVEHPPAGVSEFFVDELAMALGTSQTSAGYVHAYASASSNVCRAPGRRWPTGSWTGRGRARSRG